MESEPFGKALGNLEILLDIESKLGLSVEKSLTIDDGIHELIGHEIAMLITSGVYATVTCSLQYLQRLVNAHSKLEQHGKKYSNRNDQAKVLSSLIENLTLGLRHKVQETTGEQVMSGYCQVQWSVSYQVVQLTFSSIQSVPWAVPIATWTCESADWSHEEDKKWPLMLEYHDDTEIFVISSGINVRFESAKIEEPPMVATSMIHNRHHVRLLLPEDFAGGQDAAPVDVELLNREHYHDLLGYLLAMGCSVIQRPKEFVTVNTMNLSVKLTMNDSISKLEEAADTFLEFFSDHDTNE